MSYCYRVARRLDSATNVRCHLYRPECRHPARNISVFEPPHNTFFRYSRAQPSPSDCPESACAGGQEAACAGGGWERDWSGAIVVLVWNDTNRPPGAASRSTPVPRRRLRIADIAHRDVS